MSQAYHPTATERFQVTEFRQEAGARQRLEERYRQGVRNWQPELSQPATSSLPFCQAVTSRGLPLALSL